MIYKLLSHLIICVLLSIALPHPWCQEAAHQQSLDQQPVLTIAIDGAITPFVVEYIKRAILEAKDKEAAALLITLDTPGGLYDATRNIVKEMLASTVPIIVYVSPAGARAGSAGVFIALAAHVLAMAPSTNIGAAHPVNATGGDVEGDMKDKVTNDAKAWARSIAETRGKNADWAEKAVVGSDSISAIEAKKLGVIDIIINDVDELLKRIDGQKVKTFESSIELRTKASEVVALPMTLKEKLMRFLSNPNLIYILMLLGFLGIFIEFQSPGLIIPGLFGVLFLAVVFGVQILPINWFGALLVFGAIAFFIAEIFITSFGLLSIAGLALLIVGSYLLFSVSGSSVSVEPLIIWIFSGGFAIIIAVIGIFLLRAKNKTPTSNVDALVGQVGLVKKRISSKEEGLILLHGSFWRAYSSSDLEPEDEVVVKKVMGTKVFVDRTTKD